MNPRPLRPVAGTTNADVISRYHSPAATPCTCSGPPCVYEAYPIISRLLTMLGRTQATQEHRHVDGEQRPGDDRARDRAAAEGGPRLAGAPRTLAHAVHALLAHRGRAHAVGARIAPAPDAGDVRFPAGMAVTGGSLFPPGTGRDPVRPARRGGSGIAGRAHGLVQSG